MSSSDVSNGPSGVAPRAFCECQCPLYADAVNLALQARGATLNKVGYIDVAGAIMPAAHTYYLVAVYYYTNGNQTFTYNPLTPYAGPSSDYDPTFDYGPPIEWSVPGYGMQPKVTFSDEYTDSMLYGYVAGLVAAASWASTASPAASRHEASNGTTLTGMSVQEIQYSLGVTDLNPEIDVTGVTLSGEFGWRERTVNANTLPPTETFNAFDQTADFAGTVGATPTHQVLMASMVSGDVVTIVGPSDTSYLQPSPRMGFTPALTLVQVGLTADKANAGWRAYTGAAGAPSKVFQIETASGSSLPAGPDSITYSGAQYVDAGGNIISTFAADYADKSVLLSADTQTPAQQAARNASLAVLTETVATFQYGLTLTLTEELLTADMVAAVQAWVAAAYAGTYPNPYPNTALPAPDLYMGPHEVGRQWLADDERSYCAAQGSFVANGDCVLPILPGPVVSGIAYPHTGSYTFAVDVTTVSLADGTRSTTTYGYFVYNFSDNTFAPSSPAPIAQAIPALGTSIEVTNLRLVDSDIPYLNIGPAVKITASS